MKTDDSSPLFYGDIYEAIERTILSTGLTKKDIATRLYPGKENGSATSYLSRALSPAYDDVRFSIENLVALLDIATAAHLIYFLCDRYSFDRPAKKTKENFKRDIQDRMKKLQGEIKALTQQIERMPEK